MSQHTHTKLLHRLEMANWQHRFTPEAFLALSCLMLITGISLAASLTAAGLSVPLALALMPLMALVCAYLPYRQLLVQIRRRQQNMLKTFPFFLDMTTLCIEAGTNFHGALLQVATYCPDGPLKQELSRTLAQIRAGMPRHQALDDMANRTGLTAIRQWVLAVRQAEQIGMSLGPLLRAQATRQRSERFLRAERNAMQAPVKMLFPLVLCIFPCTFLIIGFPVAMQLLGDLT